MEKLYYLRLNESCLVLQKFKLEMQWMYNEAKAAPARMRVKDFTVTWKHMSSYTSQKDQQLAVAWNWQKVCHLLLTIENDTAIEKVIEWESLSS